MWFLSRYIIFYVYFIENHKVFPTSTKQLILLCVVNTVCV